VEPDGGCVWPKPAAQLLCQNKEKETRLVLTDFLQGTEDHMCCINTPAWMFNILKTVKYCTASSSNLKKDTDIAMKHYLTE
jgi:hypothetical protein